MPPFVAVAQVLLLRHHVGRRAALYRLQLSALERRLRRLQNLFLRPLTRHHHLRLHQIDRQKRPRRRRIETVRRAQLRIPVVRRRRVVGPRTLHHAGPSIAAVRRGPIPIPPQHQHLRLRRNRRRRSTARPRNLSSLRHHVLIQRSHHGIGRLPCLRTHRRADGRYKQHRSKKSSHLLLHWNSPLRKHQRSEFRALPKTSAQK